MTFAEAVPERHTVADPPFSIATNELALIELRHAETFDKMLKGEISKNLYVAHSLTIGPEKLIFDNGYTSGGSSESHMQTALLASLIDGTKPVTLTAWEIAGGYGDELQGSGDSADSLRKFLG